MPPCRLPAPTPYGLLLCREQALRSAGFTDIFRPIKAQENAKAVSLLAAVCAEVRRRGVHKELMLLCNGGSYVRKRRLGALGACTHFLL